VDSAEPGDKPEVAAEFSCGGIAPEEAGLRLGYGGRIDFRWPTAFERSSAGGSIALKPSWV
jgi:hypothetical protein